MNGKAEMRPKAVGMVFVAALCACALSLGTVLTSHDLAFAKEESGTYRSTTFKFNMTSKGKTQGTEFRAKKTKNSVYVNVTKKTGSSCRLHVDGREGKEIRDCTVRTATLKSTGEYRIRTTVYEYGYREARLTSWANVGKCTVQGYWSPNCYGTAGKILNP